MSLLAVLIACVAVGLVIAFSAAGAEPGEAVSEPMNIDGVTVYRTERSDGERAIYTLEPVSDSQRREIEEVGVDPAPWATTGDLDGCKLLAEDPGSVTADCALMLAMDQRGDLGAAVGPAQVVHSVCGEDPDPGEVVACEGETVTEAQAKAALEELRTELEGR